LTRGIRKRFIRKWGVAATRNEGAHTNMCLMPAGLKGWKDRHERVKNSFGGTKKGGNTDHEIFDQE